MQLVSPKKKKKWQFPLLVTLESIKPYANVSSNFSALDNPADIDDLKNSKSSLFYLWPLIQHSYSGMQHTVQDAVSHFTLSALL